MTAIDPPLTLQVSDDDKVLEPYRPVTPGAGQPSPGRPRLVDEELADQLLGSMTRPRGSGWCCERP